MRTGRTSSNEYRKSAPARGSRQRAGATFMRSPLKDERGRSLMLAGNDEAANEAIVFHGSENSIGN
jgi:hypothetical protein